MSYFLCSEIGEFQKIVGGFIGMVDTLAKEVEREKMKVKIFVLPKFVDAISLVMNIISKCVLCHDRTFLTMDHWFCPHF